MDKMNHYRRLVQEVINEYNNTRRPALNDSIEHQILFDTINDHYQLYCVGWQGSKRIYFPVFHIDLKNGKIWVQEDATDYDLVGVLEEKGIPKQDIVLAFHSPFKRPYTGYAVA